MRICEVIEKNLHFISETDNEIIYLEFLTHAYAYRVFRQNAYEAYKLFPFPKEFLSIVGQAREKIRSEIISTLIK